MVKLTISEDSYSLIRKILAGTLDAEMFNGQVQDWDEMNCDVLRALIEVNK